MLHVIITQEDNHEANTLDPVAQYHIEQLQLALQHLNQLHLNAVAIEEMFGRVIEDEEPPPSAP